MKKTIYIKPRQSGKTSQVVNLVKRTKGHILILCPGLGYSEIYKREFRDESRVTIAYPNEKINEFISGRTFEFVIVDEFMHYRDSISRSLYEAITSRAMHIKNLYMIGTPYAFVDKEFFDRLKSYKRHIGYESCLEYFKSEFVVSKKTFDYWFYNFMTDYDVNLVKDDFYYSEYSESELVGQHGEEVYNVIYGNKLWLD